MDFNCPNDIRRTFMAIQKEQQHAEQMQQEQFAKHQEWLNRPEQLAKQVTDAGNDQSKLADLYLRDANCLEKITDINTLYHLQRTVKSSVQIQAVSRHILKFKTLAEILDDRSAPATLRDQALLQRTNPKL